MPGPFWRVLRPDDPRGRPKPFTVSGYILHSWQRLAAGGILIGVLGAGFGGWGLYWGMQKEKAPPEVLVSLIDRTGQLVNSYFISDDAEVDEALVNAELASLIWHLRTLTPDQPVMADMLDQTKLFFRGTAAAKMRKFLKDADWFKPLIGQRLHRIVEQPINARKVAGSIDHFRVDWTEYVARDNGTVIDGSHKQQFMELVIAREKQVPPEIRRFNPAGVFITDYQWTVTN
jgi:type IV secretory pathway TrbF-like protein